MNEVARRELSGQLRRVGAFFAASVLLLLLTGAPLDLAVAVLAGAAYIVVFGLWASTRYGWSGPGVSARIFVLRRLEQIGEVLGRRRDLVAGLGIAPRDVEDLLSATQSARESALRILARTGYSHKPPPSRPMVLFVTISNWTVGLLLGAWLPLSLADDFASLCAPGRLSLSGETALYAVVFTAMPLAIWLANKRRIRAAEALWPMPAVVSTCESSLQGNVEATIDLWIRDHPVTAAALRTDLARVAGVVRLHRAEAADITLLLHGRDPLTASTWWERLTPTPENELLLYQVLFIFGLFVGLALPPSLGFTC